jgi:hypothetical protein
MTYRGPNFNPMSEAVGRLPDNEQPKPEALGTRSIDSEKRLEYALQLVLRDALASIMNLDPNCCCPPSAADKNSPTCRCVIERVAREISQNAIEQHRLAHDHCACRQRAEIDPFALRQPIEL